MNGRARWTPLELAEFVAAIRDTRLEAAWHLVVFAGLRIGELSGLRWADADLGGSRISIRNAVVGVPYAALNRSPISHRARVVNLDRALSSLLREHSERQQAGRSEWGAYYGDHGLVVCDESGGPLHPRTISRRFAASVERAGLPPISLAALRHAGRARSIRKATAA